MSGPSLLAPSRSIEEEHDVFEEEDDSAEINKNRSNVTALTNISLVNRRSNVLNNFMNMDSSFRFHREPTGASNRSGTHGTGGVRKPSATLGLDRFSV
eukprot:snap_masked-scaffold_5-processed-gene-18.46-mRNA-1 protein AED:0.43 eAED:1.00 QI:0/0/0/1/1/1/2/0/97